MSVNTHLINNLANGYGSAEEMNKSNYSKFNNMLTSRPPPMATESHTPNLQNNLMTNKF